VPITLAAPLFIAGEPKLASSADSTFVFMQDFIFTIASVSGFAVAASPIFYRAATCGEVSITSFRNDWLHLPLFQLSASSQENTENY
jgi:hypothetical protein